MQLWVPTTSKCRRFQLTASFCRLAVVSKFGRHGTTTWWTEWLNMPTWIDQQSFGTYGRSMSDKRLPHGSCTTRFVPSMWQWLGAASRQTPRRHWMRCRCNESGQRAPFPCSSRLMHGVVTSLYSLQLSMEQVWRIGLDAGGDIEQPAQMQEKFDGSP